MKTLAVVSIALSCLWGLQANAACANMVNSSLAGAKMLSCADNTVVFLKNGKLIYSDEELTPVDKASDSQKTFSNVHTTVTIDVSILIGSIGRIIVQTPSEHTVHENCSEWGTVQ